MVRKECLAYLFLGQDSPSKDIRLKSLKQQYLSPRTQDFNFDVLYAKELQLKTLQERILSLPVETAKRIIVIKEAEHLKSDAKDFILDYLQRPHPTIILILDIHQRVARDEFIQRLIKYAEVLHFKEAPRTDTFALGRHIHARRPDYALRLLHQILSQGERPERILGGLRYIWETTALDKPTAIRQLKLLLACDLEIKTGRLKPEMALERLVVQLCGLVKA